MDRQALWRNVKTSYDHMKAAAPEGYEPVTMAYLLGRPAPLPIGRVETNKNPEVSWLVVLSRETGPDGVEVLSENCVVFVREELIQRIEIVYRRLNLATPIGFSYGTRSDGEGLDQRDDST
jgi:hypothetical protein